MRPDLYVQSEDPGYEAPVRDLPGWIKPLTLVIVLGLLGAGIATWAAGLPSHSWEPDIAAGFNKRRTTGGRCSCSSRRTGVRPAESSNKAC